MIPKIIKNDQEYQAALQRIEHLMDASLDSPEGDELELLSTLVDLYEQQFPIDPPDLIAAIRFRLEQLGKGPGDLAPILGSQPEVDEILEGKRPLTLEMIRTLHYSLGIPAEVLLSEPGTTLTR